MKMSSCKWLAVLVVAGLLSGTSALAQGKIATIDLNKAFSNYWKKKEAEANLKDLQADMDKELKSMVEEFKKVKEAYQRLLNDSNDQAVSSDEREKRRKQAEEKFKQAKDLEESASQYDRQARTRLEEQSRNVRERILTEIKNIITAKAKANGYSLVIDTAAETRNMTPVVLFNNNEFDITDSVLDQLNAAAPPPGSASPPKADPKKDQKKDSKK
jgi:outer membrane protein